MGLLRDYFVRFGAKAVCMPDLKLYVTGLEAAEQDDFLRRCRDTLQLDDNGVPTSVKSSLSPF